MNRRSRIVFLVLIIVEAAHSIEEYFADIFEVLAPARFVSGLFSSDLGAGFAIFNVLLVAVGVWCFFGPVLHRIRWARTMAWIRVVLEPFNVRHILPGRARWANIGLVSLPLRSFSRSH